MLTFSPRQQTLIYLLSDFRAWDRACFPTRPLREYQIAAALPVLAAVSGERGGAFVWLFPRQAGKDETLARLQAFLLARWRRVGGAMVMGTPTYKPQALVSRRRLLRAVRTPFHPGAGPREGYLVGCGLAATAFLSAEPEANVRGETADLLLIANEAQDITCDVWDARFMPMTASTNAPQVYSGTPWAAGSLLSRETATQPVYRVPWEQVAVEVPAYGEHVKARIAQLGAAHPFILSEYGLQELSTAGGLFPLARQSQMRGTHPRRWTPDGRTIALLLDVAGEDEDAPEGQARATKRQDATALTVVEVGLETVALELVRRPTYRVLTRYLWQGVKHPALLQQLIDLARVVWRARWLVGDATGIGATLLSFLGKALHRPGVCDVVPFVFSQQSKSDLGWAFLGAIDSGRYKEYAYDDEPDSRLFWAQVAACEYSVLPGPGKVMRWAVPDAKGHDDLLISAGLVGVLEGLDWRSRAAVGRLREDV